MGVSEDFCVAGASVRRIWVSVGFFAEAVAAGPPSAAQNLQQERSRRRTKRTSFQLLDSSSAELASVRIKASLGCSFIQMSRSIRLLSRPSVADGQDLPGMTIGFPEIETPTTEKLVDFAVGLMQSLSARVFETDSVDPFQNCIECGVADPEAIVLSRHAVVLSSEELRVNKVDRQRIVDENAGATCSIPSPVLIRDIRDGEACALRRRHRGLLTARVPSDPEYFGK